MSALGEMTLIQHLNSLDSMHSLAREGIDYDIIPTEALRDIVRWAVDYYFHSGRQFAPSLDVLMQEYGDTLEDANIAVDEEPENSVEWAIEDLRASYIHREFQEFLRDSATEMSAAATEKKAIIASDASDRLIRMVTKLENHSDYADLRVAATQRVVEYEGRAERAEGTIWGTQFGWKEIDQHTFGIHPGELAVVAGGAKIGKSWFLDHAALKDWNFGEKAVAIYTLENSTEMTLDRLAAIFTEIPIREIDRGSFSDSHLNRVRQFGDLMKEFSELEGKRPLWVLQPEPGKRSVEHIVRDAQARGAESIFIDQLSHIEIDESDARQPRNQQISNMTALLRTMLGGRSPMSCLLAHQISREGMKSADKTGYLEMYHLAESAGVERTSDWVFGLYQSREARKAHEMMIQILAARRADRAAWQMTWDLEAMKFRFKHYVEL